MTKLEELRSDGLSHVNRKLFGKGSKEGFADVIQSDGGTDCWYIYDYTVWLEKQVLKLQKKLDIG